VLNQEPHKGNLVPSPFAGRHCPYSTVRVEKVDPSSTPAAVRPGEDAKFSNILVLPASLICSFSDLFRPSGLHYFN
jgi:hypothetical protein